MSDDVRPSGHPEASAPAAMGELLDQTRAGEWLFLSDTELRLGDDVLIPDAAGWHRERVPALPAVRPVTLAPDWVSLVLSPSTEALERGENMRAYARNGVRYAWLVDPMTRTLEVFSNDAGTWHRLGVWQGDADVRAAPLDNAVFYLDPLCKAALAPWYRKEHAARQAGHRN